MPHVEVPNLGFSNATTLTGKFSETEQNRALSTQIQPKYAGLLAVYLGLEWEKESAAGTEVWIVQFVKGGGEIGQLKVTPPQTGAGAPVSKTMITLLLGPEGAYKVISPQAGTALKALKSSYVQLT